MNPENSATWTVGTGYVPILKSASESAEIQVLFQNEPYFRTGFDQGASGAVKLLFDYRGT